MITRFAGIVSILLSSATIATADDISPLVGGWVAQGVPCKALEDYSHEMILKIKPDLIEGYEFDCRIRSVNRQGNTYELSTICEGEGESYRAQFEITSVSKNEIKRPSVTYQRCY